MIVYVLTIEQKEQLKGQQYAEDCYFNPIQDKSGNWVITAEEVENCTNEKFFWVVMLPTTTYQQKTFNFAL